MKEIMAMVVGAVFLRKKDDEKDEDRESPIENPIT